MARRRQLMTPTIRRARRRCKLAAARTQSNAITVLASPSNPSCTCEFLTLGPVGHQRPRPPEQWQDAISPTAAYVAGTPSVQLPTTGSATYNGFMLGAVKERLSRSTSRHRHLSECLEFPESFRQLQRHLRQSEPITAIRPSPGHPAARPSPVLSTAARRPLGQPQRRVLLRRRRDAAAYQAGTFSIREHAATRQRGVFAGQR